MSTIVKVNGSYSYGIHKTFSTNDYYAFSVSNEDYVAFVVDGDLHFGNVSHGVTNKEMVDGQEVYVCGFRWTDTESSAESSVQAILPRIMEKLKKLQPIRLGEGVTKAKIS